MSSLEFRIQRSARRDLDRIHEFGASRWGEEQADVYIADLITSLQCVLDFPEIGPVESSVKPGIHWLKVEKHIAYYRIEANLIVVLRIVPSRLDLLQVLQASADFDDEW